ALGDQPDAAPLTVADLEHLVDQLPRARVALPADSAGVLVLHLRAAGFELAHGAEDAFEHVERLEAGDDDGHTIAAGDRLVLGVAHHRADVAGPQEPLHAVARRL